MNQMEALLLGDTLYRVLVYGRRTVLELGRVSEYLGDEKRSVELEFRDNRIRLVMRENQLRNLKRWARSHVGGWADGVVIAAQKLA